MKVVGKPKLLSDDGATKVGHLVGFVLLANLGVNVVDHEVDEEEFGLQRWDFLNGVAAGYVGGSRRGFEMTSIGCYTIVEDGCLWMIGSRDAW